MARAGQKPLLSRNLDIWHARTEELDLRIPPPNSKHENCSAESTKTELDRVESSELTLIQTNFHMDHMYLYLNQGLN